MIFAVGFKCVLKLLLAGAKMRARACGARECGKVHFRVSRPKCEKNNRSVSKIVNPMAIAHQMRSAKHFHVLNALRRTPSF
jgi:hypothetical protein